MFKRESWRFNAVKRRLNAVRFNAVTGSE